MVRSRLRASSDERESAPYTEFAAIYDAVMRDVRYDLWADYVEELCSRHGLEPRTVLDVACGTGGSTLPFATRGYRVAGVDASAAMLDIARAKAEAHGLGVEFARQDMRDLRPEELSTGPEFDLVICLYDSINYVTDPREMVAVLRGVRRALRPGGLFIFDSNAARRLSQMTEATLVMEGPGWVFIERNEYDPTTLMWEIRVTGFVRTQRGLWRRFTETHRERSYTEREMRRLLERAGLVVEGTYAAFCWDPPGRDSARIHFVARRPAGDPDGPSARRHAALPGRVGSAIV